MMRARTWLTLGFLGIIAWCATGDSPAPPLDEPPHAAVRANGFAVIEGAAGARRIDELDRTGRAERTATLRLTSESRVVGTTAGTAVAWRDGDQMAVATVGPDGALGKPWRFGSRARRVCDGVASNDLRWGVAFVEDDGRVWVIFGPTSTAKGAPLVSGAAASSAATGPARADASGWCSVASAGQDLVLSWRESPDLVRLNVCSKKSCSTLTPFIPAEVAREEILAFGCLPKGCGFVTRGARGAARVTWVNRMGRQQWSTALGDVRAAALVGAGDRQLALATVGADGHLAVVRVDGKGALAPLWRASEASSGAPALAWSQDRLLVAQHRGDQLDTTVLDLPR